ncbi:hypothetical protein SAMN05421688_3105 [Poseidonocella pacifica]|uniref:Uncharacterized protein n=1 Tax=Poseidonocella pacifica TaxID=871651 RepID=A0A1I0YK16_9RHOB|nr:hypothetical protein [Poseidonocella pacifica]SFB12820.1 hypothetical protein SAMN05421688_3105 [Poseidonocella pacifica]
MDRHGLGRVRLVRKACYFDGLLNGRFEVLISTENDPKTYAAAERFVGDMLSATLHVRDGSGETFYSGALVRGTRAVPLIWSRALTLHGSELHSDAVMARRCLCVIESDSPIKSARTATLPFKGPGDDWASDFNVYVQVDRVTAVNQSVELCTFTTHATTWNQGRYSASWSATRYLRTYTFRMLQDIEAMSQLLLHEDIDLEDDRVQLIFNAYTRHVLRSHLKLSQKSAEYLVEMGYAAFESLHPGELETLRVRIVTSSVRPQVAKKLLNMLDEVRNAKTIVNVERQEIIMGDKFEGNTISGTGNVIGCGNVVSVHQQGKELAVSLAAVAKLMREKTEYDDAETQATLAETAAEKLKDGDEKTATTLLGTMASWSLDLIKTAGTAALTAFVKAKFG